MGMQKKNICGGMGFGYGSKYQLLRMLGWHRRFFNENIEKATGLNNIDWLDFEFAQDEDKELLNAGFVGFEIENKWRKIWPTNGGKSGLNWDAVGIADNTYILVEAKAHIKECFSSNRGGGVNPESAIKSIEAFQNKYGIKQMDWLEGRYYQIANRLIFTDFLIENGIPAKLVYLLFLNGYQFNTPNGENKSVSSEEEWKNEINNVLREMGVKGTEAEKMIHICIIDCNQKK